MAEITSPSPTAQTSTQPNKFEQLRVIPWSLGYDLANTFFVQLSFLGSIFILFLNDLKLTESQIGLLLATFPFLSLLSLFITQPVARLGYRKTFMASMAVRNIFTAGLLLVPFLAARVGLGFAIAYVAAITVGFATSRAVAMTAFLPWQQEYIPQSLRGRVSGYSSIIVSLAGLVAVAIGGFLINRPLGLWRYPLLFGIGVLFGMISIFMSSRFPGGRSFSRSTAVFRIDSRVLQPLKDSRFVRYLVVLGLITLAVGPVYSFLPLFMRQKVGLDNGSVVFLQTGSLIGSLLSS
jgi:MFS family permease